jgi:hypothetical protein
MAPFIDLDSVRVKFHLTEAADIDDALLNASIADAHADVLDRIRGEYEDDPPEPVVTAETLLAGAALLRSLAARMALDRRELRLAGQQMDTGKRLPLLLEVAEAARQEADRLLRPYLRYKQDNGTPLLLTDGAAG